ncbi:LysR family transcriptional regulator [Brevundimonas sp. UBA7534]|uniref:LysR family transcriptional regulator n=1 Tax=Brevundimonas sp. UBA7534 TaxID=1946138 RepID=UPI0025C1C724|nr:LysR family transcriptional regulator [Brevundimonas sp. UBA7534]
MDAVDLNLLRALDVLLTDGSVTGAARRLGLSASAMSRTLARLRAATGDPLLVRAGRGLVPTPRALDMRDRVHALARDVREVLRPDPGQMDLFTLERTFTIRAGEGFVEMFSPAIVAAVRRAAPRMRLRFAPKPDKSAEGLREGRIDLEVGVLGEFAPEVRARLIFRDRFVGVARVGHALLAGRLTPERYSTCEHVVASRRGAFEGPVDEALGALGFHRTIRVVVPGFSDALRLAKGSDLIALIPGSCVSIGQGAMEGLVVFELPVTTPEIAISALWHPRMDADPLHRWFRDTVIDTCRQVTSST